MIDVQAVRKGIVEYLAEMGFVPRDADITDLQHGTDNSLRFKVGTSMGEVAVIAVYDSSQRNKVWRITQAHHIIEVRARIRDTIRDHWYNTKVDTDLRAEDEVNS